MSTLKQKKNKADKVSYLSWGDNIDENARLQMDDACSLPISRKAALMPDAHVGYGLPIGGVLAVENAVIPYAVGVDIACRVKLSVFDINPTHIKGQKDKLSKIIEENTQFGVGAKWRDRKEHDVLDEDWESNPVTKALKDLAWSQLGTSGSGNHFVEFGEFELLEGRDELPAGRYLGLVSHSGSRGAGSKVADFYSKLAASVHPELSANLRHLAWLSMDAEGAEYWNAMELMGKYASANHFVIHKSISKALGEKPIFQVENHHNFAWMEEHDGQELIVHRKGATPAGEGQLGYIPGTMVAPGFLVLGKGNKESLRSCSHGAGRVMSRNEAKKTFTRSAVKKMVADCGVHLLSAGVDESPQVYKDIESVMSAQSNLVHILGRFQPRIVKMAPEGERAED